MPPRIMSIVAVAVIVGTCVLFSTNRRKISWTLVFWGLGLQYLLGLLILKTYPEHIFAVAQSIFQVIQEFSDQGARFLFGSLVERKDFVLLSMASVIVFVSSLMAILNYLRIIPAVMYCLAKAMQWTMRTSGAETLAAAMQILMGIEAVTGLKAVIGSMTRSELFTVMTCFLANIAGSVMAVYVGVFGASAGHILAASVMSAPAAMALSKIMIPETATPETAGRIEWKLLLPEDRGIVDAAANGALDGLKLAASIGAVLLAFVSIIHMLNSFSEVTGTSLLDIAGYVFTPIAYLLGIPTEDCFKAGSLLAVKTIFNEWIAYGRMQEMVAAKELSPRAVMILTYALCNFANFGSLAILIGGISGLAPGRRQEASNMGMKALLAGLLSGFMTASIAGTLTEY